MQHDKIYYILTALAKIWRYYPELRFTQLICLLTDNNENIYHLTDAQLMEKIQAFDDKYSPKSK